MEDALDQLEANRCNLPFRGRYGRVCSVKSHPDAEAAGQFAQLFVCSKLDLERGPGWRSCGSGTNMPQHASRARSPCQLVNFARIVINTLLLVSNGRDDSRCCFLTFLSIRFIAFRHWFFGLQTIDHRQWRPAVSSLCSNLVRVSQLRLARMLTCLSEQLLCRRQAEFLLVILLHYSWQAMCFRRALPCLS